MSRITKKVMITIILALLSLVSLTPFYLMIVMGTQNNIDLYQRLVIVPGSYLMKNLETIMSSRFDILYFNSLIVSVSSTVLSVLISSLAGFSFAKFEFKFKSALFGFILLTLMIPSQLGLIAYVIEMKVLGFSGTLLPLIFPWLANAFGLYWMTQYIKSNVPTEVMESARIDGSSELSIFFKIIIPYVTPALTSLSLLIFLWTWNNYLLPLLVINEPNLYTIPLGIKTLGNKYLADFAAQILGISLGTLPILLLFIIGSKSFIRGITDGAVKG